MMAVREVEREGDPQSAAASPRLELLRHCLVDLPGHTIEHVLIGLLWAVDPTVNAVLLAVIVIPVDGTTGGDLCWPREGECEPRSARWRRAQRWRGGRRWTRLLTFPCGGEAWPPGIGVVLGQGVCSGW